jgi:putative PIN family toxin of toxin-antitoxin system
MPNRKDRVVIDTNLWISFLLTKDLTKLDTIIAVQELTLIFSQELIDEFVEVTQRSKFRRYFPLDDVEELLLKIRNRGILINVTSNVAECRDPKDNFLLALSLDGKVTHLITGDKDLLVLEKYGMTRILTITEYLTQQE